MKFTFVTTLVLMTATSAWAQESCQPQITLQRMACAHESHGTAPRTFLLEERTVNEGADGNDYDADVLCQQAVPDVRAAYPNAVSVTVTRAWGDQNAFRGFNSSGAIKVDVKCNFSVTVQEPVVAVSDACPVERPVSNGCLEGLTEDYVRSCIAGRRDSLEAYWLKIGCLEEAYNNAYAAGLSAATYNAVVDELGFLQAYLRSQGRSNTNFLADYITGITN